LQEVTITLEGNAYETPVYFNMSFNHKGKGKVFPSTGLGGP
jgi:hypothetical protein